MQNKKDKIIRLKLFVLVNIPIATSIENVQLLDSTLSNLHRFRPVILCTLYRTTPIIKELSVNLSDTVIGLHCKIFQSHLGMFKMSSFLGSLD